MIVVTALGYGVRAAGAYPGWDKNEGAIRLYTQTGFRVTGRILFEVASRASTDYDLIMTRTHGFTPRQWGMVVLSRAYGFRGLDPVIERLIP